MRTATIALLILTLSACAGQRASVPAGSQTAEIGVPPGATVLLRLPAGEIAVSGTADDTIAARVEMSCQERDRGCLRRVEKVRFDTRSEAAGVLLALTPDSLFAWRDVQARIDVSVPADAPLRADIGAGSLTVENLRNCVELDMYAGEATLRVRRAAVSAVSLDVGTGDASLRVDGEHIDGRRALLVGAELEWRDDGDGCSILGDLQFGELEVQLEDD